MQNSNLPIRGTIFQFCEDLAELAGLESPEAISLRQAPVLPPELDRLDPFFDALGSWNSDTRTITIDRERCLRVSKHSGWSPAALINTVVIHFCAKAVLQLGIHRNTGKQYIDWDSPGERFVDEGYPLRPTHSFFDQLVREQELFTQIFTALYLADLNDPAELEVFRRLSRGHCDLYSISYSGPPEARLVTKQLQRDWATEIENERAAAKVQAQVALYQLTRLPPDKEGVLDLEE